MWEIISIKAVEVTDAPLTVQVPDAKQWAAIDHDDDNMLLFEMISGATADVESETGTAITPKAVTLVLSTTTAGERVPLPYGTPSGIVVKDSQGQTVSADGYAVSGQSIKMQGSGEYTVTYTTGATTAALNELIKMVVAYRYNNRGDGESELPAEIKRRMEKHKREWL